MQRTNHLVDLPISAFENVTEFLSVSDMCSMAKTCSPLRALMVQRAEDETADMGKLMDGETVMQLWKIRTRIQLARAVSQRISLDVENCRLTFVGTRADQSPDVGVYLMGSDFGHVVCTTEDLITTGPYDEDDEHYYYERPNRVSKKLCGGFDDERVDLGDVPITAVCGPMMLDTNGHVHWLDVFTKETEVDVKDVVSDAVALSSHLEHAAIVTSTGTVMTCGSNHAPKLGYIVPNMDIQWNFKVVDALSDKKITQVATGHEFMLALDADGHVYAWGDGRRGNLGRAYLNRIVWDDWVVAKEVAVVDVPNETDDEDDEEDEEDDDDEEDEDETYLGLVLPKRMDIDCVAYIAAGREFSMMITVDGRLFGCGDNAYGQLGLGDTRKRMTPTLILGPETHACRACYVSCGAYHTLLLTASPDTGFQVWATGANSAGQLGLGDKADRHAFTPVNTLDHLDIACVCTARRSSAAVTADDEIYVWGECIRFKAIEYAEYDVLPRRLDHCFVSLS